MTVDVLDADSVRRTIATVSDLLTYLQGGTLSVKPAAVVGQVTWTKGTVTIDGTDAIPANADRVGLIVFNRIGNAQIDIDIAGGTVAANTGRSITGGNDYYFMGAYCPVGTVTIFGTNGQVVTYWEAE